MICKSSATRSLQAVVLLVAIGGSWAAPAAYAQTTGTEVDQTVDQVEVFSISKLLRLRFDPTPTNFVGLTATPTSNLRACQSSNVNGLFCLDGQVVRNWPTTVEHPSWEAPSRLTTGPRFSVAWMALLVYALATRAPR